MIKHTPRVLRLRDGRLMEYAEYGDPKGIPMLYFHGFLGSCHQAGFMNESAARYGFRVIAPNRPGIGKSTHKKHAGMTDYAADITELVDFLHVDECAILGASGGGCFALACTYALPHRVRFTGVAGGIVPLNLVHNLQHMHWFRRLFLSGCNGYPRIAGWMLRFVFVIAKRYPRFLYYWLNVSTSIDVSEEEHMKTAYQIMWWDYEDVFLQKNGVYGLLDEIYLYFHWNFELRAFPQEKTVLFWHGKNDPILRWSVVKQLARHMTNARAIIWPGGHLAFLNKVDAVLSSMHDEWDRPARARLVHEHPPRTEAALLAHLLTPQ